MSNMFVANGKIHWGQKSKYMTPATLASIALQERVASGLSDVETIAFQFKQARKSSEDAQATGYTQFQKNWAG